MERIIYEKFNELIKTKGTKAKALWVKNNLSEKSELNDLIIYALNIQFDPRIKTNLAKKSMKMNISGIQYEVISNTKDLFDYVTTKCTGKDIDIASVLTYLNDMEYFYGADVRNLIENIVIKNLKLGITGKAINEAIGRNIIYVYDIWKGHSLKDMSKINGRDIIVSDKIDGYRSTIKGGKEIYSANGIPQPIENFPEIHNAIKKLDKNIVETHIIDGEVIYNKEPEMDRITRYNKTSSIMGSDGLKYDLTLKAFDLVPIKEFDKGLSTKGTLERKNQLKELLKNSDLEIEYLSPLYVGKDVSIIQDLFADAIRKGDEGLILQTIDSKYETRKVSDGMWKLKVRETADLKVVGFEEGKETGKNKGTLGMMLVEYKGSICGVGSGFKELINIEKYPTENTRDWIWQNRESLIGKIAEIEYDENKDKDGNYNLRHGSFLRWRFDKTEPSLS